MSAAITIIDYRAGNIASVLKAFEHLGASVVVTGDAEKIATAEKLVLPGVGHFAATRALDPLRESVLKQIASGTPFLGICVGMQWMFDASAEATGVSGLGLIQGMVECFPATVKSPHVGWNTIAARGEPRLLRGIARGSYVYYTHSYRCPLARETAATTDHGGEFSAVVELGNVFGVQFHPEISGETGLAILRNFVELPC